VPLAHSLLFPWRRVIVRVVKTQLVDDRVGDIAGSRAGGSGAINRPAHGELVMKNLVVRFVREDAGQDLIEYGLLVGIITVGAIASIKLIGPKVATYFSDLNAKL